MEDKNTQNIEMRLYELNKSIMGQMPTMDKEIVVKVLKQYFDNYENVPAYHMLLSAEGRDFTVIEFTDTICEDRIDKAINEIVEVIDSRGPVKDIAMNGNDVDIWINDVYYKLFDYSWGIITV